jgi:hypothetical protein
VPLRGDEGALRRELGRTEVQRGSEVRGRGEMGGREARRGDGQGAVRHVCYGEVHRGGGGYRDDDDVGAPATPSGGDAVAVRGGWAMRPRALVHQLRLYTVEVGYGALSPLPAGALPPHNSCSTKCRLRCFILRQCHHIHRTATKVQLWRPQYLTGSMWHF